MPLGLITISSSVSKRLSKIKKNVFFGGTYSGNSIVTFIANNLLIYTLKNKKKIFNDLEKKSNFFETELNKFFIKKKLDLKIYRFKSLLRLVYTKSNLKNRSARDFFESKKNFKINTFKKYLRNQNIYLSPSGLIFFSISHNKNDLKYLISKFKIGLSKYF